MEDYYHITLMVQRMHHDEHGVAVEDVDHRATARTEFAVGLCCCRPQHWVEEAVPVMTRDLVTLMNVRDGGSC